MRSGCGPSVCGGRLRPRTDSSALRWTAWLESRKRASRKQPVGSEQVLVQCAPASASLDGFCQKEYKAHSLNVVGAQLAFADGLSLFRGRNSSNSC